ncbi:MAG: DUF3105 domain-containing protein [Chloroflexi bacterium]|nr:DUF3105 domain-containing protein [Chloroflexota bacterium]
MAKKRVQRELQRREQVRRRGGARPPRLIRPRPVSPTYLIVGSMLGGILFVLLLIVLTRSQSGPGTAVSDLGNLHIPSIDSPHQPYNSDPPTSGPHVPSLTPWGVHQEPIPRELQVHNLEDGGVLVQYNCSDDCPDLVAQLEAIVKRYPDKVILAPYPGMRNRIAMTAWTRIDTFDEFDEQRITRFIDAYRGIDHHK